MCVSFRALLDKTARFARLALQFDDVRSHVLGALLGPRIAALEGAVLAVTGDGDARLRLWRWIPAHQARLGDEHLDRLITDRVDGVGAAGEQRKHQQQHDRCRRGGCRPPHLWPRAGADSLLPRAIAVVEHPED